MNVNSKKLLIFVFMALAVTAIIVSGIVIGRS